MAGRPKNTDTKESPARLALLNAASTYLAEKPSAAISIRAIADYAGVNSALISYYFGGKEGLLAELIDAAVKPLLTLDLATLKLLPPAQRSKIVIGRFIAIHQSHRWLPRLMIDDLMQDQGTLQEHFQKQVGGRLAKLLNGFIRVQQDDGYFRADLDARHTAVALLSLLAFPFVALPLLEQTHQLKASQLGSEKWINHLCGLFEAGCRA
jgi:TetR/AcrR family transcriptional regulator